MKLLGMNGKKLRHMLAVFFGVWAFAAIFFTQARTVLFGAMLLVGCVAANQIARWIVHANDYQGKPMSVEIGKDGEMLWERVSPPLWWPAAGRSVVADRHLSDGTRQHMVEGSVVAGTKIDNAQVIGQSDTPDAEFSAHPSHLK